MIIWSRASHGWFRCYSLEYLRQIPVSHLLPFWWRGFLTLKKGFGNFSLIFLQVLRVSIKTGLYWNIINTATRSDLSGYIGGFSSITQIFSSQSGRFFQTAKIVDLFSFVPIHFRKFFRRSQWNPGKIEWRMHFT